MQQARELMRAMIGTFGFLGSARRYLPPRRGDSVAQALVRALGLGQSPEVRQALDRLLVIVADHEFTPATFAARIAASTGNDLYSCIGAALQVHFGAAMGLRCDRIEESLHHTDAGRERGAAIVSRSRELEHPLYREGDPRAVALMDIVEQLVSAGAAPGFARAAIPPRGATVVDLDYALVAVCRALGAVPQAAGGLLAFGRTAGWIAHVFEQRGEDFVIRPRARFIPRPPCVGRA
jgi:citrate synthase